MKYIQSANPPLNIDKSKGDISEEVFSKLKNFNDYEISKSFYPATDNSVDYLIDIGKAGRYWVFAMRQGTTEIPTHAGAYENIILDKDTMTSIASEPIDLNASHKNLSGINFELIYVPESYYSSLIDH